MAGAPRQRKRQTQKTKKQKQTKQQQQRKKQQQRNGSTRQEKYPFIEFVHKMLQNLFNVKRPRKAYEKAIFIQRYVLTTQEGQQQCFLSKYMYSEATVDTSSVLPATVWLYKPPMTTWPVMMHLQQQNSLANQQWQDGQQYCIISNAVPSTSISGTIYGTTSTEDVQHKVNEMVLRWIPCFFTRDPSPLPF